MADLPTNLKDDILDSSVNTRRKYRMIENADGTVEFEDMTEYSQMGDEYGAGLINETNRQVNEKVEKAVVVKDLDTINAITQEGYVPDVLALKEVNDSLGGLSFGYDSGSNQYGYWKKEADTAVFVPFSNAQKLYEALEYSGLVTSDMTFDEMCTALSNRYPKPLNALTSLTWTASGYNAYVGSTNPLTGRVVDAFGGKGTQTGNIYSGWVDITHFTTLSITGSSYLEGPDDGEWAAISLSLQPESGTEVTLSSKNNSRKVTHSFTGNYNVAGLTGKYRLHFSARTYNGYASVDISDMRFTS